MKTLKRKEIEFLKEFCESLPKKHPYFVTAFNSKFSIAEINKLAQDFIELKNNKKINKIHLLKKKKSGCIKFKNGSTIKFGKVKDKLRGQTHPILKVS